MPFVTVNGHVEIFVLPPETTEIKRDVREKLWYGFVFSIPCWEPASRYSLGQSERKKWRVDQCAANMLFQTPERFEHVFWAFTLVKKSNNFPEPSRYAGKRSKANWSMHKIKVETISDSNTIKGFNIQDGLLRSTAQKQKVFFLKNDFLNLLFRFSSWGSETAILSY